MDWRERISVDPEIHHGEACVRGTRVPVRVILGSLSDGHEPAAILRQYPQLTLADVQAALGYAAEVLQRPRAQPPGGSPPAAAISSSTSPSRRISSP